MLVFVQLCVIADEISFVLNGLVLGLNREGFPLEFNVRQWRQCYTRVYSVVSENDTKQGLDQFILLFSIVQGHRSEPSN